MKLRNLRFTLGTLLLLGVIASCKKDNKITTPVTTGSGDTTKTTIPPPTPKSYVITEDFEESNASTKTAYADANVTFSTGSWDFNNALIGTLAGDAKDGTWAVRINKGFIAMNFDINGLTLLSFKHAKYGKDANAAWQLQMSTDGGATYTQVGMDYNETANTLVADSVKITVTGKVRFKFLSSSATRINIDDIVFKGTGDPGITVTTPPPTGGGADSTATGTATATRGVTVGTDAPPAEGDNSNLLLGNPSNATASTVMMDNYLIDQGYYVESYSSTKAEPNWVSWHLDSSNLGSTDRLNNFAGFSGLPSGWFVVQDNSYNFAKYGFERGHNCPSADRTSSTNANSSTFLMTNMIPQSAENNEHTWANLEDYIRTQVKAGNEAYIIMGSYGTGGTSDVGAFNTIAATGNGSINIPSNVWKVAVIIPAGNGDLGRITASARVIAVNTPNNTTVNADWTKNITTENDIETAASVKLFSALPADVQTALKAKKDAGQ